MTTGKKKPYKSAAECIDFSLPCPSIFERAKPLVPNTQRRIARGLDKFVIREAKPYLVHIGNGERNGQLPRIYDIDKPLNTVVSSCKQYLVLPYLEQINHSGKETRGQKLDKQVPTITSKHGFAYIAPSLIQYHSETAKSEVRGQKINKPIMTIDGSGRYGLQIPFLTQYYSGADHANTVTNPLQTVTVKPRHFLNDCFLTVLRNHMDSKSINEPLNTITARAMHFTFVKVYVKQYSEDVWLGYWQKIRAMLNEYTDWNLNDNEIIVFNIDGTEYFIYDIGMRMLQPKELYAAQGFPKDYVIEKDYLGNTYPKSKQVARCGNAVPPPFATALVRANLPEYCDTYILTMADLMERMAI